MFNEKELVVYNNTLKDKRCIGVENVGDGGFVLLFEGNIVVKVEPTGYDHVDVELAHRVPTYAYESIQ